MRDAVQREEKRRRRRESSSRTTLKTRERKEERQTGTWEGKEGYKESTGRWGGEEQGIWQAAIKGGRGREEERVRGG